MIGDKLVITEYHLSNGRKIARACIDLIKKTDGIFTIAVAGESGSGKSETAATTAQELEKIGKRVLILGQDDYFALPPKSNSARRLEGIGWVGPGEVRLDLLDEHLAAAKRGDTSITKPLVHFEENMIDEEIVSLEGVNVVIAEGTYTSILKKIDFRAFIDRTYHDTLKHRKERARDQVEGEFIDRVLEIEHEIISAHKARADIVLPP